jgi:hypothetical protein
VAHHLCLSSNQLYVQSANVVWRLEHGELPDNVNVNIYWLWSGVTDLLSGYCSEEATVLGILRTAEELAARDTQAVVVVQGILPVSRHNGELEEASSGIFHHPKVAHSVNQAKQRYTFWPSIKAINKELEDFCTNHPQIVYYDASKLFLGSMGNEHFKQANQQIIHELMPDYVHLSFAGYKVLLNTIKGEVERILWDTDETNDVEEKKGGSRP